jgi:hypothetical protein
MSDTDIIEVHCEWCGKLLWIRRVGVTVCSCGVRHTFVPS